MLGHRARRMVVATLLTALCAGAASASLAATKPTPKPRAVSATGPTGQVLTVSQATNLSADEQWVTVSGRRYDETMGILVTLCVVPAPGELPTPCGSGIDKLGITGTSRWVSSNPPLIGKPLAKEFGVGGTFKVTLKVSPHVGDNDCRKVKCGVFTRGDMTQLDNRSVDVYVPVTFKADPKKQ